MKYTAKQKALLTVAIVFLVLAMGLFYVNKVLLPVQLRGMIIKSAEDALHRKVTFDTIHWGPLKGLAVTNLTIYDQKEPAEVLFHVEKAAAQVLFWPLFNKKLIIPWASIEKPSVRIVRLTADTWNFSDLLTPTASATSAAPAKGAAPDILIGKVLITEGRLKIIDNARPDAYSEMVEPINIRGNVSVAAGLHLTGNIALPETKGTITFDTRLGLKNGSFKGEAQLAKVNLARYARFIPNLPLEIKSANIEQASLTARFQDKALTVSGDGDLPVLDLGLANNVRIKSAVKLEKTSFNLTDKTFSLQGTVTAHATTVTLDETRKLEGDLRLGVTKLSGNGNSLSFSGNLSGDKLRFTLDSAQSVTGNLKLAEAKLSWDGKKMTVDAEVEVKNLNADLGSQLKVTGDITCPQLKVAQELTSLTIAGDLKANKFQLDLGEGRKVTGDLATKQARLILGEKNLVLTGDLALDGALAVFPGVTLRGNLAAPATSISLADEKFNAKLQMSLKNGEVALAQDITFRGDPSLNVTVTADAAFQKPEYTGTLILEDAVLTGLPTIGKAEGIRGNLAIETDKLSTKDLTLNILETPVAVSGEVRNLIKPVLDLTASALKVDLAIAEKIIPQIFKDNGLKVAGTADISVHVSGPASQLDVAKITADAKLYDATVTSEKLKQEIQKINGSLELTTPTLSWKDLTCLYQGRDLTLNGYLKDFQNPYVATTLKADNIAVDLQAQKTGDTIRVENFSGSWFDSSVNASGRIDLPQGPGKDPVVNFVADGKISLGDLSKMVPKEQAKDIEKLNLSGVIKVSASAKGNPADWQHLNANVSMDAAAVWALGYKVEDLAVTAVEKDGVVDPLDIKGKVYGGNIGVISNINLEKKNYPFETSFKLADVDIALLKSDSPLKDRELSGLINATGNLKGALLDWKTMQGKTTVAITQGHLFEVEILSKLLTIVSTSFQGGDMVITEASALFEIGEGKLSTNNLTLKSPAVTLLGEGWMDLDQNIDLNVTPRLEGASGATGAIGVIQAINPTAGLLNIRITGTVTKPQFNHNVSAPTMIKKTLQNTVGNILKIFE
jgi:uncharacterized protein involved in outer membrane biogenesis